MFSILSVVLACDRCRDDGRAAECIHLLHLVPRWQSGVRHTRLKTIMQVTHMSIAPIQWCFYIGWYVRGTRGTRGALKPIRATRGTRFDTHFVAGPTGFNHIGVVRTGIRLFTAGFQTLRFGCHVQSAMPRPHQYPGYFHRD